MIGKIPLNSQFLLGWTEGFYTILMDPRCLMSEFLKIPDQKYPAQDTIRIILDNHFAHTFRGTQCYIATLPKGRFKFVVTPRHGSWLNMIESFFSKMTKQMLRGIRVNTKPELLDRIYQYFDEVNQEPVVYHWKYKMDEITEDEAASINIVVI